MGNVCHVVVLRGRGVSEGEGPVGPGFKGAP